MKRALILTCTAVATAALTSTSAAQDRTPPPDFTGVEWVADSVTVGGVRHQAPGDAEGRLTFHTGKGTFSGWDSCNRFRGDAAVDVRRGTITFGEERVSTVIGCHPSAFLRHFAPVAGPHEVRATADTLTLTGPDGYVLVLRR
ncbi:META domain-containing protein [Streptomyces sp. NPDC088387]|uniref:META domain-containing protein n=1 Tax=Streptomyces sp. NPDC088387 TaxID=3365859 RepID=UPI0038099320